MHFINAHYPTLRQHITISFTRLITCAGCNTMQSTTTQEYSMSLLAGHISTEYCVASFTSVEDMPQYNCPSCNQRSFATTKRVPHNHPPVIVMHNLNGHAVTVQKNITYYGDEYGLLGFILMYGRSDKTRHYTCVRLQGGQLYEFNDEHVEPFKKTKSKRYSAYIIFYGHMEEHHEPDDGPQPAQVREHSDIATTTQPECFGQHS